MMATVFDRLEVMTGSIRSIQGRAMLTARLSSTRMLRASTTTYFVLISDTSWPFIVESIPSYTILLASDSTTYKHATSRHLPSIEDPVHPVRKASFEAPFDRICQCYITLRHIGRRNTNEIRSSS